MSEPTRTASVADPLTTLSSPAGSVGGASTFPTPADPGKNGERLAPPGYELQDEVGRGAMGVVYRARDKAVGRDVAVKLLQDRFPTDSPTAVRFLDEARITGQLQHPAVPAVHQVGTLPNGRPFLVMKLIKGRTLADLLADPLAPLDRLGVFEGICQAVGYAHAHGVIHRDLKPANVMVGAFGEVQVMDWGLAKVLAPGPTPAGGGAGGEGEPPAEVTEIRSARDTDTRTGSALGTPAFMAPEQAAGVVDAVDRRSDVFGLGAVLCALLTGRPPYLGATVEEILPRAARAELAGCFERLGACGADPDLVALCQRCLSAERTARPADATAVAAAVAGLRAAADERARKAEVAAAEQRTRRRLVQWAGGAVAAVLLAGVVGTSVGLVQADQARGREKARADGEAAERAKAEKANALSNSVLDAMTSSATGHALTAQGGLTPEQKRFLAEVLVYYRAIAADTGDDEASRERTAVAALRVGQIEKRLGNWDRAEAATRTGIDAFERLSAGRPESADHAFRLASGHIQLGTIYEIRGQWGGAEKEYRAGLAAFSGRLSELNGRSYDARTYATGLAGLGVLYQTLGRRQAAIDQHHLRLQASLRQAAAAPADPFNRDAVASGHSHLALALNDGGRVAEAERHAREALAISEQLVEAHPADPEFQAGLAGGHNNLAMILHKIGKNRDAERHYRTAVEQYRKLVDDYPGRVEAVQELARARHNLATTLEDIGRLAEAEEQARLAVGLVGRLARNDPGVPSYQSELGTMHHTLGNVLGQREKAAAAVAEYLTGLAVREKLAAAHPEVPTYRQQLAHSHLGLANRFTSAGRPADAERHRRECIDLYQRLVNDHPDVAVFRRELAGATELAAEALAARGELKKAEQIHRDLLAAQEKLASDYPDEPDFRDAVAHRLSDLGHLAIRAEEWDVAAGWVERAVRMRTKLVEDFPQVPDYRHNLSVDHRLTAAAEHGRGNEAAAERAYQAAIGVMETLIADLPDVPKYRSGLAGAQNGLGAHLIDRDRPVDADRYITASLREQEKLASDFPDVSQHALDLGGGYCNYGLIVRDRGDPAASLSWFDKAIDRLTPLTRDEAVRRTATNFLRNTHSGRAEAFHMLRQYERAIADWDKAVELSIKAHQPQYVAGRVISYARAGRVKVAVAETGELRRMEGWPAPYLYDFAAVYAIAAGAVEANAKEYGDEAVKLLREAVKEGFANPSRLMTDDDFRSLRDRDDFKQLLARLTEKFPPKREQLPPPRRG